MKLKKKEKSTRSSKPRTRTATCPFTRQPWTVIQLCLNGSLRNGKSIISNLISIRWTVKGIHRSTLHASEAIKARKALIATSQRPKRSVWNARRFSSIGVPTSISWLLNYEWHRYIGHLTKMTKIWSSFCSKEALIHSKLFKVTLLSTSLDSARIQELSWSSVKIFKRRFSHRMTVKCMVKISKKLKSVRLRK